MLKNSEVRNLENTILSVVAKGHSELDLSSIINNTNDSNDSILKSLDGKKNLLFICCDNFKELVNDKDSHNNIKIVFNSYSLDSKLIDSNSDRNRFEIIGTDNYDLRINPQIVRDFIKDNPVTDLVEYKELQENIENQKRNNPLIDDNTIDAVFIDLEINSVDLEKIKTIIIESFRIIKKGGKIVLRTIMADEPCNHLLPVVINENKLKTVFLEKEEIELLDQVGFHGMKFEFKGELPIKVVDGVEFREFVISAYKGKQGPCLDCGQAVMYRGPWKEVIDDDGHRYVRGERVAVCSKTYGVVNREPYKDQFVYIPCYANISEESAPIFDCNAPKIRDIHVTKGLISVFESKEESACDSSCSCGCE